MFHTADPIPRSTKFRAPGQPVPADRLAAVRALVEAELQAAASDLGHTLQVVADGDERLLHASGLALPWVADFAESTVKRVIRRLSADLIGGANVTRLDRSLTHPHPRLPYRRALRIVGARGWRLPLGEELPAEAQASLVRFCGLLPVQLLFLPGQPRPATVAGDRQGLSYVLPWGGEVARSELPLPGAPGPGVCRLRVDRLLHFLLGQA